MGTRFALRDTEFGSDAAANWGGDYKFPIEIRERDTLDLIKWEGNLAGLCKARQVAMHDVRLSVERLQELLSENVVSSMKSGWRACRDAGR